MILLGRLLGTIDFVSQHIETILILIVLISVLPIVIQVIKSRRAAKRAVDPAGDAAAA